jgi:hypothetical protein
LSNSGDNLISLCPTLRLDSFFLSLSAKIRQILKNVSGTNTQAYFFQSISEDETSFITLMPAVNVIKHFSSLLMLKQKSISVCTLQIVSVKSSIFRKDLEPIPRKGHPKAIHSDFTQRPREITREKRSSLFCCYISDEEKRFMAFTQCHKKI